MSFQWPYVLIAVPFALAGLAMLFLGSARARERLLGQFASSRLLPLLLVNHSNAMRRVKNGMVGAGVLLVVVALARPQWGYDWQEIKSKGVDVVFVMDTSRSMLTQDVLPSRLERAKLAIYDCLEKMNGNRVGLVAFAGDAFLQCPLTLDYDAFRQSLEAVDTNTIADGGTDIAIGLDVAAKALEDSGNHKVIVLLTDGEDLEGQGIGEAKALADQGVTVYSVGVGTPQGELIPIRNASGQTDFVRDERGEIVKSRLDADTLTQIAGATHGFYQPLGATGDGLAKVYDDGIKKMPEQNLASQMKRLPIERFQWPLALAFVLLSAEMLIGTRKPRWSRRNITAANLSEPIPVSAATGKPAGKPLSTGIAASILLTVSLFAITNARADNAPDAATTSQPVATKDASSASVPGGTAKQPEAAAQSSSPSYSLKDAENLFQQGKYAAAATAYQQAADAAPQDSRFRYNQGESLYRSGDFEGASTAFSKTLSTNDLALQQQAYYNLGNAQYRLGESQLKDDPNKTVTTWESSVKNYQNALDLNKSDADAAYNMKIVNARLDELKKKQQQQQNQQNDNQQNQQNNDQQKQDQNNSQQNNQQNQQNKDNPQNNKNDQNQKDQQSQNNQDNKGNPSGQNNNSQQNPQNNSQQNQSGGQQNQQNNKDQNNSQQNNNGQNPQQQNKSGQNPQNPQNNGGQPKPQNSTGDKSQNRPQNGNQQKQNPQNGQNPGTQNAARPQSSSGTGSEPKPQNQGQQQNQGQAPAGSGTTDQSGQQTGAQVVGVMSRQDAQQLLDSLKVYERKLPAAPAQGTAAKSNPDESKKDW